MFSRSVRREARVLLLYARRLRLENSGLVHQDRRLPLYRPWTLVTVAVVTAVNLSDAHPRIYASGRAVAIDLSVLPYVVLVVVFLVEPLVPFTVNGIGVREAFFVSFLGTGAPDDAFGLRLPVPPPR